jgi:hypothetical protein
MPGDRNVILKKWPSLSLASLVFTLWYCTNGENPAGPDPVVNAEADPFGVIQIILRGDNNTASFLGKIYDGPQPPNILWDESMSAGCLKLVTPQLPFCANPCGSDYACVSKDSCQVYPKVIQVGQLQVTGLITNKGTAPLTISPLNNLYQAVGLKYPPFNEGDTVSISASGSESSPAFTLKALGFSPLKVSMDTVIPYLDDKPIDLKWEAPTKPISSMMDVVIDISFHGGTKAKIIGQCEDNGSLTIPANMLNKLKTYGISGYPRLNMTRMTRGTDAKAKAELAMESTLSMALEIPGLVSCNKAEDCPDGKACLPDRRCE